MECTDCGEELTFENVVYDEDGELRCPDCHSEIQLTNAQFDNFMAMCKDDRKPSPRMAAVVKRLREEGF